MKINQFIFQRKIKKFRAGQEREKRFMNYNDIKSVLILYESELSEKNKKIKAILKSLQEDGKKVTLCGYVKKKKSESPTFDHSCMIDLSHINFFKEPDKNFIRKLLSNSFDAVIDLTLSPILPLQYVLAYSNAPFKAGRKNEILNLLDFMINIKSTEPEEENKRLTIPGIDEDYLYRQIIFYLKNIESNN